MVGCVSCVPGARRWARFLNPIFLGSARLMFLSYSMNSLFLICEPIYAKLQLVYSTCKLLTTRTAVPAVHLLWPACCARSTAVQCVYQVRMCAINIYCCTVRVYHGIV